VFFSVFVGLILAHPALADLSTSKLQDAYTAAQSGNAAAKKLFDQEAKAFTEAAVFTNLLPPNQVKYPGNFRPYLETGFHFYAVNNELLANFTDSNSGSTPDFFHAMHVKVGGGLPFGFVVEGALSYQLSKHSGGAASISVGNQIFDFANTVYTDIVPAVCVSATMLRSFEGPPTYAFTGQAVMGAYHRQSLTQFGMIVQYTYALLRGIDPGKGYNFIRYGAMTSIPVWLGLNIRTELFYPSMSGSLAVAYHF